MVGFLELMGWLASSKDQSGKGSVHAVKEITRIYRTPSVGYIVASPQCFRRNCTFCRLLDDLSDRCVSLASQVVIWSAAPGIRGDVFLIK
jgi:hypothetical protein